MNRRWVADGALAGALLIVELIAAGPLADPRPLNAFGAVLLTVSTAVLVARRSRPLGVLLAHLALAIPYHANEFPHEAVVPATIVALYTVARYGTRARTASVIAGVLLFGVGGILLSRTGNENTALQAFGAVGWIVLACVAGEAVRLHRAYIAEALDRAERAERSRDAEARRQVAEERLRIARDLHDLLAHTITVIQVQAGVAAHLLTEGRADRTTVVAALDTIADACADARAELAATVGVLRTPGGEPRGPLPALAQLSVLAEPAEAAGAVVEFETTGEVRALAPTVEMVAYRIVQEALTNVAKHARATRAAVRLDYEADRLIVRVTDDGRGASVGAAGFGIRGMIERAEAVGGSLRTLGTDAGFAVIAELPIPGVPEAVGAVADSPGSSGDARRGGAQAPMGDLGRGGMGAQNVGVQVDGGSGRSHGDISGGVGVRGGVQALRGDGGRSDDGEARPDGMDARDVGTQEDGSNGVPRGVGVSGIGVLPIDDVDRSDGEDDGRGGMDAHDIGWRLDCGGGRWRGDIAGGVDVRGGVQTSMGDGGRSDDREAGRGRMDARDGGRQMDGGTGVRGSGDGGVRAYGGGGRWRITGGVGVQGSGQVSAGDGDRSESAGVAS